MYWPILSPRHLLAWSSSKKEKRSMQYSWLSNDLADNLAGTLMLEIGGIVSSRVFKGDWGNMQY